MLTYFKERKEITFSLFKLFHQMTIAIVIPFLSIILLKSGWDKSEVAYFFAAFTFSVLMLSPGIGKISDIFGRKRIILIGILFQIMFLFSYYFFLENKILMIFIRILDGISFICVGVVSIGAFEDVIKNKRGFWTGIFFSIASLGAIIAPIIGGYIIDMSSYKNVFLFSVLFFIACFFLMYLLPEKQKKRKNLKFDIKDLNPLRELKEVIIYKKFQAMMILGISANVIYKLFIIFFPIYVLESFDISVFYWGLIWSINPALHLFQFYFGKISDKISSQFGVLLGITIFAITLFSINFFNSIFKISIMMALIGLGLSIWNVNAWSLLSEIGEKNKIQGEITGMYYSISYFGMFFAELIGAQIIDKIPILTIMHYAGIYLIFIIPISYIFLSPVLHPKRTPIAQYCIDGEK